MGGVDHPRAGRHLVQLIDEDRALLGKIIHDVAVVHDLLAHVDGRAKGVQGNLDDIDGPNYAGTEAAGLQEENALGRGLIAELVNV